MDRLFKELFYQEYQTSDSYNVYAESQIKQIIQKNKQFTITRNCAKEHNQKQPYKLQIIINREVFWEDKKVYNLSFSLFDPITNEFVIKNKLLMITPKLSQIVSYLLNNIGIDHSHLKQ